jgi:hypothetical protein
MYTYREFDKHFRVIYFSEEAKSNTLVEIKDGLLWQLGRELDTVNSSGEYMPFVYILTQEETLHIYQKIPCKVHHSSITGGGPVAGAGMIEVVNGKIKYINLSSGHYQPAPRILDQVIGFLKESGADLTDVFVDKIFSWKYD